MIKIPQNYDATVYERIIGELEKKITALEGKLKVPSAKSLESEAAASLDEDRIYIHKGTDQIASKLVVRSRGRVYNVALTTS